MKQVGIITLARCEMTKIMHQRKYRIYPAVVSLLVMGGAIISLLPGNSVGFSMANYPYTVLSMLCYVLAPIAIFMLVSDLMSGEMAGSEIKMLLGKPISRASIYIAKVAAIAAYTGLLFLSQLILSGVISMAAGGLALANIATALLAYAVGMLPMLAFVAMSVCISSLLKSASSCFGYSLLAYVALVVLGTVFSGISPALLTSYLGLGGMVIGSAIPLAGLLTGLAVLGGYTLFFLSVGSISFEARDF